MTGVAAARREKKRGRTYTREGAGGARDRALSGSRTQLAIAGCAAFLRHGQALVGL